MKFDMELYSIDTFYVTNIYNNPINVQNGKIKINNFKTEATKLHYPRNCYTF